MSFSNEQIEERRRFLGASEAAAAIGLSPWKTPYQLWREKCLGEEVDLSEQLAIEVGRVLEPLILDRFMRNTGLEVHSRQLQVVSKRYEWCRSTLDGKASDDGVVEAKSAGFAYPEEWGEEDTDMIPMHHYVQVQHQMHCCDAEFAHLPVIFLNRNERLYRISRNDDFIEKMLEKESVFMDLVKSNTPPELKTLNDVKLAFPRDNGMSKYIDPEHYGVLTHFKTVKEELKKLEEDKKSLQTSLAAYLGDNTNLVDPASGEVLLTYKSQTRTGIDSTSLKKEQPNIFKAYSKTSEFRVMRTRGE